MIVVTMMVVINESDMSRWLLFKRDVKYNSAPHGNNDGGD